MEKKTEDSKPTPKTRIEQAIDAEAVRWAEFFGVTDAEEIEGRKQVMRANVAVGYLDPLLPFIADKTGLTRGELQKQCDELLAALKQAVRYIEVSMAYRGAMTADQVEAEIKANAKVSQTDIAANSCHTLATFNFEKARAAIAKAEGGPA